VKKIKLNRNIDELCHKVGIVTEIFHRNPWFFQIIGFWSTVYW